MAGALFVTGVIGFGVITGLNVTTVTQAVEHLATFDISLPKPPPPQLKPKPQPKPKAKAAPAAAKASSNPKPKVKVPTPQSAPASAKPGAGNTSAAGQGDAGTGTGAGGVGSGTGGVGGGGGGNTPARLIRNLSRSDYRRLTGGRMPQGMAELAIRVNANGRIDSCRVEHSSGDPVIDAGLCPLVSSRLRFEPALNSNGQPIPYFTHYLARWSR